MKYEIYAKITLKSSINPKLLEIAIVPENTTMPEGNITSKLLNEGISNEIRGKMSIGRLKYTIDDMLNAAILAEKIAKSV